MKCARIRELLSEYMDGTLDPERTRGVKDHLSRCERCSKELASLKAVADALDSLEPVKAPNDFLERVHLRIHQRSRIRKMLTFLFVPAKIKIPLECAGALATAVLVILLFKGPRRTIQIAQAPSPSVSLDAQEEETYARNGLDERKIAQAPSPSVSRDAQEGETYAPKDLDERKMEAPQQQTIRSKKSPQPPETSLPQDKGTPTVPLHIEKETGWEIIEKRERMELALVLEHARSEEVDTSGPDMDQEERKRFLGAARPSGKEDQYEPTVREGRIPREKDKAQSDPFDQGLSGIMASIEKVNGRYISTEYDQLTRQPQSIIAEVPSENYDAFIEELTRLGTVEGPFQLEQPPLNGLIQVRIKLIQPTGDHR